MLSIRELAMALSGVGRLLRLDAAAFERFDASPSGFWKSFWVAGFLLPLWGLLLARQMAEVNPGAPVHYAAVQTVGYAVGWLAYPLLMVNISRFLDRWPRYFAYMVAYNWFQLVQLLAWLPFVLLVDSGAAPRQAITVLWLAIHGLLLGYGWFIARRGLDVEGHTAFALVLIDLLLGLLIDGVAEMLA